MTESWVEIGGRRVRFLEAGAGAPVIFAAGLGISADFYQANMAALARSGFRAITPDLPGFGKTKGPPLGSNVQALADHLVAFAKAINVSHAGWIGHSLGCQPILRIAVQHPELVKSMVLAGPTGGHGHRLTHQVRALAYAAVTEPWRLMRAVLRDYARLSPFVYLGTWVKSAKDDPLLNAKRVRLPAIILVGTKDRVPRAEFLGDLARLLKADVIRLPGGNHGLPIDAEKDFNAAAVRFFKQSLLQGK